MKPQTPQQSKVVPARSTLECEHATLEIPSHNDWLAEKVKIDSLLYNMRKYNAFTVEELQEKMKQQCIKK